MGNQTESFGSLNAGGHSPATLRRFYSEQSWIDGEALRQLEEMLRLEGAKALAAFPDLHPGKYGATGVALLSHRLHPLLIGNDIGCGMALFALDLPLRKLRIDKAEQRLRELEHQHVGDAEAALTAHGLPHDLFPEALGTIGGGNHFCELQAVDRVFRSSSEQLINDQCLYLLVHSGSRGVGAAVLAEFLATNEKSNAGLEIDDPFVARWMAMHDQCVAWAMLTAASSRNARREHYGRMLHSLRMCRTIWCNVCQKESCITKVRQRLRAAISFQLPDREQASAISCVPGKKWSSLSAQFLTERGVNMIGRACTAVSARRVHTGSNWPGTIGVDGQSATTVLF